jgi:hypothetical protein
MWRMQALIQETQELLEQWKHPDPYRPPTAPGGEFDPRNVYRIYLMLMALGSKYERNLPAPILDRKYASWTISQQIIDHFYSSAIHEALRGDMREMRYGQLYIYHTLRDWGRTDRFTIDQFKTRNCPLHDVSSARIIVLICTRLLIWSNSLFIEYM